MGSLSVLFTQLPITEGVWTPNRAKPDPGGSGHSDRWGSGVGEGTLGLRTPTSGNLLGSGREPYRDKSKIKNRRKFRHRHSINSGFFLSFGERERD